MSYQVLARKWRPQRFADVIGQGHVLTALTNSLKENRLHHAYLFSGTRGVGKTSIARLFAKGLNCELGTSADPCGKCANCQGIEEGRFIDLIEIDAASRTKVEDTRELLDNVQYKPVQGRFKVYLIDEVHMLSRHSFNALLKTLEEPPEYVKFLLATTEPQKLPITILSRCMQFHLKALDCDQISLHLQQILTQENIQFERAALDRIAKAANGSIRDSLSLTDQAIAVSNANISLNVVRQMLGLLDENHSIEIIHALHQGNGEKLMQAVQQVSEKGGDWQQLLVEVSELLHQIAMQQLLPQPELSEDSPIVYFAKYIAPEDLQFFYQILLNGRKELPFSPEPRSGVEMILLRALAFHPKFITSPAIEKSNPEKTVVDKVQSLPVVSNLAKTQETDNRLTASHPMLEELQRLRNNSELEKKKPEPIAVSSPSIETNKNPVKTIPVISAPTKTSETSDHATVSRKTAVAKSPLKNESPLKISSSQEQSPIGEGEEQELEEIEDIADQYRWKWAVAEFANKENAPQPSALKQAILDTSPSAMEKIIQLTEQQDAWAKLINNLNLNRLSKILVLNTYIIEQDEGNLTLGLRSKQQHLNTESQLINLQQALTEFYNRPMQLKIEISDDAQKTTPAETKKKIYDQLHLQVQQDLEKDELVQQLKQEFDAEIDRDFINLV